MRPNRLPTESERAFQAAVVQLARLCGYLCYHTYDSRKSPAGFVDLVMAKPGRPVLLIEVKTATGRVSLAQRQWLDVLQAAEGRLRAECWRPSDWNHIEQLLLHGMP